MALDSAHATVDRADVVMGALALAILPALLLEGHPNPAVRMVAIGTNWVIWFAFCAEFVWRLRQGRWMVLQVVRREWFNVALILLSPPFLVPGEFASLRSLRVLRVVRLLRVLSIATIGFALCRRVLQHQKFHYVLLVAAMTVTIGTLAIYVAEGGRNPGMTSIGDALWWVMVTATTVGYGDVSPMTTTGRFIGVGVMLVGIGVIGIFTATLASFLLQQDEKSELDRLHASLHEVHSKLDRVLAERNPGEPSSTP